MNYFLYHCHKTEFPNKMAKKMKKAKKVKKSKANFFLKKKSVKKIVKKVASKKDTAKITPKKKLKTKPKAKHGGATKPVTKSVAKKTHQKPEKKIIVEVKTEFTDPARLSGDETKSTVQKTPTHGKLPVILVKPKSTKTVKKIMTALTEVPEPKVFEITKSNQPEPNGKFKIEFVFQCSVSLMYEFISQPSGLSEWFADDVNIKDNILTFFWDGQQQRARIIGRKEGKFIRFQWLDKPDNYFFEFAIEVDDLTGDISLIITDFAEDEESETAKLLWEAQVGKLHKAIGS